MTFRANTGVALSRLEHADSLRILSNSSFFSCPAIRQYTYTPATDSFVNSRQFFHNKDDSFSSSAILLSKRPESLSLYTSQLTNLRSQDKKVVGACLLIRNPVRNTSTPSLSSAKP
jgi:hypothetical protein